MPGRDAAGSCHFLAIVGEVWIETDFHRSVDTPLNVNFVTHSHMEMNGRFSQDLIVCQSIIPSPRAVRQRFGPLILELLAREDESLQRGPDARLVLHAVLERQNRILRLDVDGVCVPPESSDENLHAAQALWPLRTQESWERPYWAPDPMLVSHAAGLSLGL